MVIIIIIITSWLHHTCYCLLWLQLHALITINIINMKNSSYTTVVNNY